jgi:hypothetical protein
MSNYKELLDFLKKQKGGDILHSFHGDKAIEKYLSFNTAGSVQQFSPEERKEAFFVAFRRKLHVHYEFVVRFYIGSGDDAIYWGERIKEDKWDTVRKAHDL